MHHWLLSTSESQETVSTVAVADQSRLKEVEWTVADWVAGVVYVIVAAVHILAVLLRDSELEVVGSTALNLVRLEQLGEKGRIAGRSGR